MYHLRLHHLRRGIRERRHSRAGAFGVALVAAILPLLLIGERPAHGETLHCETVETANVVVHARAPRDAALACEGARDAIRFLSGAGADASATIDLHIVRRSSADATNRSIAGYYDPKRRRIYVLSYAELEKRGTPFGMPVDATLYRSIVTHEVAHAIEARNFAKPAPPLKAKEYIAFVTMFATMSARQRQRLFKRFPAKAFASEADINSMIYALDPIRFGISAYKHFARLENGAAFIRRILAGQALSHETLY